MKKLGYFKQILQVLVIALGFMGISYITSISILPASTLPASTMVESIDDHNWRMGKEFSFTYLERPLRTGASELHLVIAVGSKNIAIKSLRIEGTSSIIEWQLFTGSSVDRETGTEITEIRMNTTVNFSSDVKLLLDPTIIDIGTSPMLGMSESVGVTDTFSRSRIHEDLITTKLALLKNTDNILKIKNIDSNTTRSLLVVITFAVI